MWAGGPSVRCAHGFRLHPSHHGLRQLVDKAPHSIMDDQNSWLCLYDNRSPLLIHLARDGPATAAQSQLEVVWIAVDAGCGGCKSSFFFNCGRRYICSQNKYIHLMQVSSKLEKCHVISLLHGHNKSFWKSEMSVERGVKKTTQDLFFFFFGKNTFINKRTVVWSYKLGKRRKKKISVFKSVHYKNIF